MPFLIFKLVIVMACILSTKLFFFKVTHWAGFMIKSCNPSTCEAEARGVLNVKVSLKYRVRFNFIKKKKKPQGRDGAPCVYLVHAQTKHMKFLKL